MLCVGREVSKVIHRQNHFYKLPTLSKGQDIYLSQLKIFRNVAKSHLCFMENAFSISLDSHGKR